MMAGVDQRAVELGEHLLRPTGRIGRDRRQWVGDGNDRQHGDASHISRPFGIFVTRRSNFVTRRCGRALTYQASTWAS
jgi:hypothetical protein